MSRSNIDDAQAHRVRHTASRFGATETTLTGSYTISPDSGSFHFLNSNGGNRTIFMPPIEPSGGQLYIVINRGSSGDLNIVTSQGVGITDILPTRSAFLFSSASTWHAAIIPESQTPENAEYIVGSPNVSLTNERTLTDSVTISWDLTAPGIVKANALVGGGNVSKSGTPLTGQIAQFLDAFTIAGVDPLSLGMQPLDADLTALAALGGTNTIYYRSAANTWTAVTVGSGLTFVGGNLSAIGSGSGNVSNVGTPVAGQLAVWTDLDSIQGIDVSTLGLATLADPIFSGNPRVPTVGKADNDTTTASTAFVHDVVADYAPLLSPTFSGTPAAPTPTALDNSSRLATTAYVDTAVAATSAFTTGDAKLTFKATADASWIMANDGSIGNASSGATTRANADTSPLFILLYTNVTSLILQDSSGSTVARGANAAADFGANRRLVIPKTLGRSIASAGAGSGLTSRALGTTAGSETETPTVAKTASHTHTPTGGTVFLGNSNEVGVSDTGGIYFLATASGATTQAAGSGTPLNILDPTTYMNVMIKL